MQGSRSTQGEPYLQGGKSCFVPRFSAFTQHPELSGIPPPSPCSAHWKGTRSPLPPATWHHLPPCSSDAPTCWKRPQPGGLGVKRDCQAGSPSASSQETYSGNLLSPQAPAPRTSKTRTCSGGLGGWSLSLCCPPPFLRPVHWLKRPQGQRLAGDPGEIRSPRGSVSIGIVSTRMCFLGCAHLGGAHWDMCPPGALPLLKGGASAWLLPGLPGGTNKVMQTNH